MIPPLFAIKKIVIENLTDAQADGRRRRWTRVFMTSTQPQAAAGLPPAGEGRRQGCMCRPACVVFLRFAPALHGKTEFSQVIRNFGLQNFTSSRSSAIWQLANPNAVFLGEYIAMTHLSRICLFINMKHLRACARSPQADCQSMTVSRTCGHQKLSVYSVRGVAP